MKIRVTSQRAKETKNTVVYSQIEPDPEEQPVVKSLYVSKEALGFDFPELITLTLETEVE